MFKRREGVTFVIKNGNRNEMLCLYDKPYRGKSNGIYANIGDNKDKVISFIEDLSPFLEGMITNFTCNEGHFKEEEIPEKIGHSKGSSFRVTFDYNNIPGFAADIYIPSVRADKTLEIAKLLRSLQWKAGEIELKISKVTYTQTF